MADSEGIRKHSEATYRKIIWLPTLVGLVFMAAGFGGLIWGEIIPLYEGFQSRNWEEVDFEIVRCEYRFSEEKVAGISVELYRFDVEYIYEWKGMVHEGTGFQELVRETEAEAKNFIERFPVGKVLNGFVNPDAPEESTLTQRRFGGSDVLVIFMMLLCIGGGGLAFAMGFGNHERVAQV